MDPCEEMAARSQPDETQAEEPAATQLDHSSSSEEELLYLKAFKEASQRSLRALGMQSCPMLGKHWRPTVLEKLLKPLELQH